MGQQQGGSGSGHMRVVQEVISSHGGNVLGNVGLGQGGSGSGHMQVVQEVTRQGSTVLENVGLGHSRGVGGLGLGGINRFTSHGTGVLQQVGLGHSYGGRSGVQGYEEGSQSTSSYRTSGGSYGSYNSRSGTSGGGLAGGLLGLVSPKIPQCLPRALSMRRRPAPHHTATCTLRDNFPDGAVPFHGIAYPSLRRSSHPIDLWSVREIV
ncbi:hypothetical protein J6590_077842 [Homalodisca vitripennis]|nr:hypothetical protein J6590_077842 [Homalodisca vitripennis]